MSEITNRCPWPGIEKPLYATYHDTEWGVPVYDDRTLFEFLVLEGAQAGLSWYTILSRREGYRKAFFNFDPFRVAAMTDAELEKLLQYDGIIRNRLKVFSVRRNARVFLDIQKEFGGFSQYLWSFVDGKPIVTGCRNFKDIPVTSSHSDALSKDLKKRGMSFVGSTIIYAYMQATGLVNDHLITCWRHHLVQQ